MLTSVPQTDAAIMPCAHRNLIIVQISSCLHILSLLTNIQSQPFLTYCLPFMHHLHCTQSKQDIRMHTVACTPCMNFLFHMP
jgi:hypothetical protein